MVRVEGTYLLGAGQPCCPPCLADKGSGVCYSAQSKVRDHALCGVAKRRNTMRKPETIAKSFITRINVAVAVKMTMLFGSIWCVYAFFVFSLVPLIVPQWQNTLLYISNCIQLVALPALMVGSAVLSQGADQRASEDHTALLEILSDVREELADLKDRTAGIARDTTEALERPAVTDVSISDQTIVLGGKPDEGENEPA